MPDGELAAFQPDIWQCWHETLGGVERPTWDWQGLSYPYWRVYWNRQPGARVTCDGIDYPLDPEFVVVVTPNAVIDHHLSGVVDHTYIHATLGYPYDGVVPHVRRVPVQDVPIHLLNTVFPESGALTPGRALGFAQTLAAHAFVFGVFCAFPSSVWPKPAADPAIRALVWAISRRSSEVYRTTDMAERCGMSVNTLLRRFREQIGRSPQQFVTDCRLQKACVLLHRTSRSVEQIAESCGFCDRYHFSKVFKRRYRCGPAAFRHQPFAPRLFRTTP